MIKIKISHSSIEMMGHANWDIKGKDIVCAGISALVFTFISSVKKLLRVRLNVVSGDGIIYINWQNFKNKNKRIGRRERQRFFLLLRSLLIGLNEIAKKYPENVIIEGRHYGA